MRIVILSLAALLVAFQDDGRPLSRLNKEAMKGFEAEWDAFKPGAWAQYKDTYYTDTFRRKAVLKEFKAGFARIETSEIDHPTIPPMKKGVVVGLPTYCKGETRTEKAELTIDGKKHDCIVYSIVMPLHGPAKPHTVRVWKSKQSKLWAVAFELVVAKGKQLYRRQRWDVIKEKEMVKVGTREIPCAVYKVRQQTPYVNLEWKEWRSSKVPGHLVRMEKPIPEIEGATESRVLVDFGTKEKK